MKIAFVAHRFLPEGSGGVEVLTFHLARALIARGHEVGVICAARSSDGEVRLLADRYEGVRVWRIAGHGERSSAPIRSTYRDDVLGEAVARLLDEQRPDVVHLMNCLFLSASVIVRARQMGFPVIWTLTDYWPLCWKTTLLTWDDRLCAGDWKVPVRECLACLIFESRTYRQIFDECRFGPRPLAAGMLRIAQSAIGRRLVPFLWRHAVEALQARSAWFRMLIPRVNALVAVSPFSFELFRAAGFPADRLHLIEQTIPPLSLRAHDPEVRNSLVVRFGYIGRMNHAKGVDLLIRAFREADLGPRATLDLFGPCEEASFRRRLLRLASGDPRIRFHEAFPPEHLGEILSQLDVLVIPSRWAETGPLTMLEAFAAGLPVIGARVGQMERAIEPGRNGLLFERGRAESLAAALRRIVWEPDLLSRLRRGIASVKSFAEMVREYEELYRACVRDDRG